MKRAERGGGTPQRNWRCRGWLLWNDDACRQSAYTCDGERFDNTHLHLIADHLLRALQGSLRTKVQEPTNDPAASEEDPRLAKH